MTSKAGRDVVKCRWCGWRAYLWSRGTDGKVHNGNYALREHVEANHEEELPPEYWQREELDELGGVEWL